MYRLTPPLEGTPRGEGQETMDSAADIDLLYERHLDALFSYVWYRVPNHTEAEDITAETFAAAITAFARFRGDCSPFAWLLGIARQKIAEAARRWERQQRWELREAELTVQQRETLGLLFAADIRQLPESAALRREAQEVMRQLLVRLPEPQREALLLQVDQNLSIREIAKVLGRSEAATNSLLERGRATLFRQGQQYFKG
jgi:RNA polymerase sigma-70 factor, ECF subfamily